MNKKTAFLAETTADKIAAYEPPIFCLATWPIVPLGSGIDVRHGLSISAALLLLSLLSRAITGQFRFRYDQTWLHRQKR